MIQVIIRAIDILEFVAMHDEPVQLSKIADHVKLSHPTTANIVKTLLERNYLEQMGRKTGYRLGIGSFHLTGTPYYQQNLINVAKPIMEELTQKINETSLLAIIQNNKRVILHRVECNQVLQVRSKIVDEVYNTTSGRLLMAYLNPKELAAFLKQSGFPDKKIWPNAQTIQDLEAALQEIREKEFVQLLSVHHTVGFAIPVYQKKKVIASFSVFTPESRFSNSQKDTILKLMRNTTKKITEQLEKLPQK